jgi:hypothetical protein
MTILKINEFSRAIELSIEIRIAVYDLQERWE